MLHPVMIADCELKVTRPNPEFNGNLEIRLGLPKTIDLTGIQPVKNHPSDHFRYNNRFGSFYVHCGCHASFSSAEPINAPLNFDFESMYRWAGGYSAFRIWDPYGDNEQLQEGMNNRDIIQLIRSSKGLAWYLHYFFEWLHEFRIQYGDEKHFHLPTQQL